MTFYVLKHHRTGRVAWTGNVYEANYWSDGGYILVAETPFPVEECAGRLPTDTNP